MLKTLFFISLRSIFISYYRCFRFSYIFYYSHVIYFSLWKSWETTYLVLWILFNVLTGILTFKTVIVLISAIIFFVCFVLLWKMLEVGVLIRKWVYIIHSFIDYESKIGWLHLLGCSTVWQWASWWARVQESVFTWWDRKPEGKSKPCLLFL